MDIPNRQIRAAYTDDTVTVYQAYKPQIADAAIRGQRFPDTWSRERMTWVKPSFTWMMYRSGWATKPKQERVLALEISREGFEAALAGACLSHYDHTTHPDRDTWGRRLHATTVRIQWDPERDLTLRPLAHRSLQLGLAGWATRAYADEWTRRITDVTALAHRVHDLVRAGDLATAAASVPAESVYPLPDTLVPVIGATALD
ncbi:DUF4291 domain-containing protein [Embleya sp. NBC_00888]|uniref:DUF4291 domain-containing protein n=1 Tax=Embleya sp. NBC_00888 TaxID=2975960 RepID=UPI00386A4265|nr:DUF4291 domain-containing protein [Embleya sp. NBC_00888]